VVKATDTKSSSAHQTQQTQTQGQQPFFNKEGGNALLSESAPTKEAPLPFFVQRKLTVGPVDDPLEREADNMADQVVQRLAQPGHEQTVQRQSVLPAISPVSTVQPAQKAAAQPEALQMKEETEQLETEDVPVQRKPIFDSMAEDTVQRKCSACGKEETLQRKEEPEKLETIDMPIQRKCAACEKEEKLQRQEASGADTAPAATSSESTSGQSTPAATGSADAGSTAPGTPPADAPTAATSAGAQQPASAGAPLTPGVTGLSFNLDGPLTIDWKAMNQPFSNRGAEHLQTSSIGAVQERWLQTFQLMQSLGFNQTKAAAAANKMTPMAVDNALKGDFPTRSEQIDRDLGSSPVGGSFSIQFKREAHHVQRVADPLQRKCAHCEQEEKKVQRHEKQQASAPSKMDGVEQRLHSSSGKGSSMPAPVRTEMESAFGTDFSNVRIHTNSEAVGLNNDLHAQAFTHGSDIYFNEGKYNPGSSDGKKLLAHELTHTIQQGAVPSGTVQQKPKAETGKRVQRLSLGDVWDATGGAVGRGLSAAGNAIAETAGDVVEWGAEKLEGLVESIAPGLLTFLKGDIIGSIKNKLITAIDSLTGGLFSRVQTEGLAAILQDLFGGAIQRIGGGVTTTCSALADMAGKLWAFVKKLTGPALGAFKSMMQSVGNFFSTIWNDFALPAWDAIKKYAGAAWDWIVDKATWLWDLTAPVRSAIGRAWNWVKTQFGIAWSNTGSVLEWLKNKATQAWNWVKSAIEPIMGPLKVIGAILLLLSPAGPIILIYKGAPHIWNAIKWLAENFNKYVLVRARAYLRNTIIPAIQSVVTTIGGLISTGINWVKGLFDSLVGGITAVLNAVAGLALFRFLAGMIRRIVSGIRTALQRVSGMLSTLANSLVSIATRVWNFIKPFAELLRQLLLVGVLGPFAILDDGVWNSLNRIVNIGLEIPCVRELEGLLHVPWILAQLDKFRKMMKGVYEIMKNPQPLIDEMRLAIGNLITQIAPKARAAIAYVLGPSRAHHLEGIMRHLEPKLAYLATNWWEVIKQTGWDMLWPWPAFAHECGEIWDKGKSMFSNFFRFEFSKGIDDGLAIFRLLNSLAGHLYGWFAIASVLVGTVLGAIFGGGAGAAPGFWAGVAVAVEVGEVLMVAMLAAEGASIEKSVFDLSVGSQTEEQNEEDYEQIASSGLNLGIIGAMVVLGELAVKFGKTVLQQVKGLFRRKGAVPEVTPPVKGEAPRVEAEPPPVERPGGRTGPEAEPPKVDAPENGPNRATEGLPEDMVTLKEKVNNPENVNRVTEPEFAAEYDVEVQVGEHTFRRRRDNGAWCRFSEPVCGLKMDDVNVKVDEALAERPAEQPKAEDGPRTEPEVVDTPEADTTKIDPAEVTEAPAPGAPGSPEHRAARWEEYVQRTAPEKRWSRERWDKQYDVNMQQANRANKAVADYHETLGWGKREVTLDVEGVQRRLDIADVSSMRGIEHKTGDIYASQDILWEVYRDQILVKEGWDITWVFEGTASKPLQQALRDAGIKFIFRSK
jgi:phage-related protein